MPTDNVNFESQMKEVIDAVEQSFNKSLFATNRNVELDVLHLALSLALENSDIKLRGGKGADSTLINGADIANHMYPNDTKKKELAGQLISISNGSVDVPKTLAALAEKYPDDKNIQAGMLAYAKKLENAVSISVGNKNFSQARATSDILVVMTQRNSNNKQLKKIKDTAFASIPTEALLEDTAVQKQHEEKLAELVNKIFKDSGFKNEQDKIKEIVKQKSLKVLGSQPVLTTGIKALLEKLDKPLVNISYEDIRHLNTHRGRDIDTTASFNALLTIARDIAPLIDISEHIQQKQPNHASCAEMIQLIEKKRDKTTGTDKVDVLNNLITEIRETPKTIKSSDLQCLAEHRNFTLIRKMLAKIQTAVFGKPSMTATMEKIANIVNKSEEAPAPERASRSRETDMAAGKATRGARQAQEIKSDGGPNTKNPANPDLLNRAAKRKNNQQVATRIKNKHFGNKN